MISASIVQTVLALAGAGGIGGLIVKGWDRWLGHSESKQKQTDDVALAMVGELKELRAADLRAFAAEREAAAAREALCHANLEVVRHELRNLEGMFDGLLLALRHAPPEAHREIIEEVTAKQAARRKARAEEKGQLRNEVQTAVSAARIVRDLEGGDAVGVAGG